MLDTVLAWATNPYILVLGVAFALFYLVFVGFTPPNAPPIVKTGLPVVGPILKFMSNPYQLALDSYRQYGDVFTVRVANQRLTFLVGPEACEYFFRAKDTELSQNEVYKFSVSIFGKGVVYDVPTPVRIEQIKFMSGALRADAIRSYVGDMELEANGYFGKWGDSGVADVRESLAELIILTASRCLMGPEVREHLFEKVADLFIKLDEGLLPITFFLPDIPIKAHRVRNAAREEMVELFSGIMEARRQNTGKIYTDVLDVFMNAEYKDGGRLSDREITGLMIALLFAGQHTSSVTSSWSLLFLLHPDNKVHLDAVLAEQAALIAEHGEELTYDVVMKMDYLRVCIKEALRLNPPLIFVMRKALVSFSVKGYDVPEGDLLFVSPPVSHRDESIYTDAETYDPTRFLPPREEDKKARFAYAGFGGGRHACLGENFAYAQISVILAVLLRNFDLELHDPFPEPDYTALVVGNKPCRISYTRKQK